MGFLSYLKASRSQIKQLSEINRLKPGSQWQHHRTKRVYSIICVTNVMAKDHDAWPITVVYWSLESDGDHVEWSRPLASFMDKFVPYYGVDHERVEEAREELRAAVQARRAQPQYDKSSPMPWSSRPEYNQAVLRVIKALDALNTFYKNRKRK